MEVEVNKNYHDSVKLPEFRQAKIDLWRPLDLQNINVLLSCFEIEPEAEHTNFDAMIKPMSPDIAPNKPKSKRPVHRKSQVELSNRNQYKLFASLISKQMSFDLLDRRTEVLIDNYFYLFKFCVKNAFKNTQISALLSMLKRTHDLACDTAFGNIDETFEFFKNLLVNYSVHRPPFSLSLFNATQVDLIVNYMFNTYFKQFKLYKYIFTPSVRLSLTFKYSNCAQRAFEEDSLKQLVSEYSADENIIQSASGSSNAQMQEANDANSELKEFIRAYLHKRVDKLKVELDDELKRTANELISMNKQQKQPTAAAAVKQSSATKKNANKK